MPENRDWTSSTTNKVKQYCKLSYAVDFANLWRRVVTLEIYWVRVYSLSWFMCLYLCQYCDLLPMTRVRLCAWLYFICLFVCLSIALSICPYIWEHRYLVIYHLSIYWFLYISLSIYPHIWEHRYMYHYLFLSFCLSLYSSVHISVNIPIWISIICLFLSVCLSLYPSVHISVNITIYLIIYR